MRARFLSLFIAGMLAMGLVFVACGDDDDDGANGDTTPESTNTTEADETEEPTAEATAEPTEEPEAEPTAEPTEGSGGPAELSIVAENIAFSTSRLQLQAGVETNITLTNNDAGIPHNLHIIAGDVDEATETFTGDEGPMTLTVTIDTPGTYDFRCDVHPTMAGSVVVE